MPLQIFTPASRYTQHTHVTTLSEPYGSASIAIAQLDGPTLSHMGNVLETPLAV